MKSLRLLQRYLQAADTLAAQWHDRPLLSLLAGIIGGVFVGTSTPLSPTLIALTLLATAMVWWPWSYQHLQGVGRLLLIGFTLAHLSLSWQQRALPPHHIAHHLPGLGRARIRIEGELDRSADTRHDRQYIFLRLHRLSIPHRQPHPRAGNRSRDASASNYTPTACHSFQATTFESNGYVYMPYAIFKIRDILIFADTCTAKASTPSAA